MLASISPRISTPSAGRTTRPADELVHDGAGVVHRDREADALRVTDDRRVDADQPPARVEQRAAAVAGVDRSVGLDQVFDHEVGPGLDAAVQRADDADRDRAAQAEGVADRDGHLAHLQRRRVAQLHRGQWRRAVHLHHGEVGEPVRAEHATAQGLAGEQGDGDLLRALDDVVVGQDQPVGPDDDPGALALLREQAERRRNLRAHVDVDHRGPRLLHDPDDGRLLALEHAGRAGRAGLGRGAG
ncbi:MAG: hypothetical protein QN147_14035, partial [Armatimonadota bacterium]|nr:hypothetical protein [Armatimonadota bacterium]